MKIASYGTLLTGTRSYAITDAADQPSGPTPCAPATSCMNCLDHRRELNIDPKRRSAAARRHEEQCAACAAAAQDAVDFEQRIENAMRIAPPAELEARLSAITADSEGSKPRRGQSKRRLIGLAASVLIACAALTYLLVPSRPALDVEIVQLVREATFALTPTGPVSRADLDWTLGRLDLTLNDDLNDVRFAGHCLIRDNIAAHLVLEGKRAPVTVFFMRDEHPKERFEFASNFMWGVITPVTGGGSIALVGAHGEPLEVIEKTILRTVRWQDWHHDGGRPT